MSKYEKFVKNFRSFSYPISNQKVLQEKERQEQREYTVIEWYFQNLINLDLTNKLADASTNANLSINSDYVNLRQLLEASTDYDDDANILLPSQFIDDINESTTSKEKPSTTTLRKSSWTNELNEKIATNNELPKVGEYDEHFKNLASASYRILESLDASKYLVLRAKNHSAKPKEVRGGPKTALIVYATQNCSLLYQEAFIITYRSFVSSKELIQKLIWRYLYMFAQKKTTHQKAARQTFSVLVRVIHELCSFELTRELIDIISSFIYRLIRSGNLDFAKIIRKRLIEILEEKLLIAHKSCASDTIDANARVPSIFDFRSLELAKQITYIDAELFNRIEPAEMLWWAEEQDVKKSPNVVTFTEHFNKVSYWVRTQIIIQAEQKDREKYMLKFIKIIKHLRKLGNYNSYLAILSALESGPIRRLDWPRNLREQLTEHTEIMESSHSFRNYRRLLANTMPPCLPYIGLILQDLTFVHVGNPNYLFSNKTNDITSNGINKKNLLNYGKRWQQFAILDNIRRFKTWSYDIEKDDRVISVFQNFSNFLQEDETWERSFETKSRTQRQRQKLST